jgi:hypothetical protein
MGYDLTFYGWADPASIYPFHCHILSHIMNLGQSGLHSLRVVFS